MNCLKMKCWSIVSTSWGTISFEQSLWRPTWTFTWAVGWRWGSKPWSPQSSQDIIMDLSVRLYKMVSSVRIWQIIWRKESLSCSHLGIVRIGISVRHAERQCLTMNFSGTESICWLFYWLAVFISDHTSYSILPPKASATQRSKTSKPFDRQEWSHQSSWFWSWPSIWHTSESVHTWGL